MSDYDTDEDKKTKKIKRKCVYRKEWQEKYDFIKKDHSSCYKSYCKLCRKSFGISYGGLNDVKRHYAGLEHRSCERNLKTNQTLQTFLDKENLSSEEEKIVAAEIIHVYHAVKHTISYRSLDCYANLSSVLFSDSKVAVKCTIGRTKAAAIAYNVLGPNSLEHHISYLKNGIYFSISSDATNHGCIKIFPILARYYSPDRGLQICLLDFYEDSNETAIAIHSNLETRLKQLGLDLKNVSSYSADNANVNFGIHHSVYQLLLKDNANLYPSQCAAHMLHNSVKFAIDKCEFDVEHLVLKVYSHLSYHAKRVDKLKSCFEDAGIQYQNILKHVTTRWLSLHPAIERLLKGLPALNMYFMSLEENCPAALLKYFSEIEKTECYLAFFHNVLKLLNETVMLLEKENMLCSEIFEILSNLKAKLTQRISDEFIGFIASNILKQLPISEQMHIKNQLIIWYKNILKYIEDRFDFSKNNILFKMQIFSLKTIFRFDQLVEVLTALSLDNVIDIDELYEEYCQIKEALNIIITERSSNNETNFSYEKWHKLLSQNNNLKSFLKIFQFIASIPTSNASAERVFSLCNNTWSDNRNRLLIENVKAELQIKVNYTFTCEEFYQYVIHNKRLLKCARSQKKYDFKL